MRLRFESLDDRCLPSITMPDPTAIIPPPTATNIDPALMQQLLASIGGALPPSGTNTISVIAPPTSVAAPVIDQAIMQQMLVSIVGTVSPPKKDYNFNEYYYNLEKWNSLTDDEQFDVLTKEWLAIKPAVTLLYSAYKDMETLALNIRSEYIFTLNNYDAIIIQIENLKFHNADADVVLRFQLQADL